VAHDRCLIHDPFVAAGGILIALSFMIGGHTITEASLDEVVNNFDVLSTTSWAALMFHTGSVAFGFLVAVLSGFSVRDRGPARPGSRVVGGSVSVLVGAGFLGGLVSGFVAGVLALWISRWKVPKGLRGIMPVIVIPLLSTFVTGLLLGAMMGIDLGGPINTVAYTFAVTGLATPGLSNDATQFRIMAAVMAFGSGLRAPHGGIWVVPLIFSLPLFVLAVVIGTVDSATLVILFKGFGANPALEAERKADAAAAAAECSASSASSVSPAVTG
jgi:fructose-specific phosphotransferase system IIC component